MWRRLTLPTLALLAACSAGPRPNVLAPGTRVAVEEFALAEDVSVQRFDGGPLDEVGSKIAEATALQLRARRCDATAVPFPSKAADADLVVSGLVTKIDGGSLGKRRARMIALWVFCWPCALLTMDAGAAWFTVEGVTHRPDGTEVGRFRFQGKGGGGSHEHATNQASQRIGAAIAVYLGRDPRLPPGSRVRPLRSEAMPTPTGAAVPSTRPVADRLRVLDDLQRDGLITDEEYQQRREAILDDL
jgi:hypothetical protein